MPSSRLPDLVKAVPSTRSAVSSSLRDPLSRASTSAVAATATASLASPTATSARAYPIRADPTISPP